MSFSRISQRTRTQGHLPAHGAIKLNKSNPKICTIGIDGCRSGWIAVWITRRGKRGFAIFPRIEAILDLNAEMMMIDIPIGIPPKGNRACDEAARKELDSAANRVFLGARRPLLRFLPTDRSNYDTAYRRTNGWAKSNGAGISRQLFGILPKIAEVDAIMTSARQKTLRETHPELVFKRLSRRSLPLPGKTSSEGQRLRREIVARDGFRNIQEWLGKLRGTGAKADDLLDACACCIAAQRALRGQLRTVDGSDQIDSRGLRMEICY